MPNDSSEQDRQRFEQLVREAQWWCDGRVPGSSLRDCLRSDALRPTMDDDTYFLAKYLELIDESISKRARAFNEAPASKTSSPIARNGFRLLVSIPEVSNENGLTESESSGYLDVADTPPWDSWVVTFQRSRESTPQFEFGWPGNILVSSHDHDIFLVSYVPRPMVQLMTSWIDVECFGMITWLDLKDPPNDMAVDWTDLLPEWLVQWAREHHRP